MLKKLYESVRDTGDNPALERVLMKQMMDLAGLDPLTARLAQGATE